MVLFCLFTAYIPESPYINILHYCCFLNEVGGKHAEEHLVCDFDNIRKIISQSWKRKQMMFDIFPFKEIPIHMELFSKNSPCKNCAVILCQFVKKFNSHQKESGKYIRKLTVHYIRHYESISRNSKSAADVDGLQVLENFATNDASFTIEHRPLDRLKCYAVITQWVYSPTRENSCEHALYDATFNNVLQDLSHLTDDNIEQEMCLLAQIETVEYIAKGREVCRRNIGFWKEASKSNLNHFSFSPP